MNATAIKKIHLPTKADEIAHLREFIAALPEASYLHSCLAPFAADFERDVYSDFIPSFSESWAQRVEARHDAVEAAKELRALQSQVEAVKAEIVSQVDRLRKAQHALRSLAGAVGVAIASADNAVEKAERLL